MLGFRELVNSLHQLGVKNQFPVIAHINPDLPGKVKGGAKTVVGALLTATDNIILPAFTTRTMVIPEQVPPIMHLDMAAGVNPTLMWKSSPKNWQPMSPILRSPIHCIITQSLFVPLIQFSLL